MEVRDLNDGEGGAGEGEVGRELGRDVRRKDGGIRVVQWKTLLALVPSSRRMRSARRIELCLQSRSWR